MRVIPTWFHGMLDYTAGVGLLTIPWLVASGHPGTAALVLMAEGVAILAYSLFTDYEVGMVRVLPMRAHLALDALAGGLVILSPWLLGFANQVWIPHVVIGLAEIGIVLTSQTARAPLPGQPGGTVKPSWPPQRASDLVAAPPDAGGHQGAFTRPQDLMQVPTAEENDRPNPPLNSDPRH